MRLTLNSFVYFVEELPKYTQSLLIILLFNTLQRERVLTFSCVEQILRLEISVSYVHVMEELDSNTDVFHDLGCFCKCICLNKPKGSCRYLDYLSR